MLFVNPTPQEFANRDAILESVVAFVAENRRIEMPELGQQGADLPPNRFGGTVGPYRYQLEGEEDLLHLIVSRLDKAKLEVSEGQQVASFVFNGVPQGLVWLRPGEYSQSFYVGHDDLVAALRKN